MPTGPAFDPYAALQVASVAEQEVIHAAFKALALKYHPDHDATRRAADKMAELNRAYAMLRTERSRSAYDRSLRASIAGISLAPSGRPSAVAPPPVASPGSVLGFGRYAGWSLRDLARRDPDYLLWLSRHSSGISYRTEIYGILRTTEVSAA
jgi:molecular chaperone DnaJ